MIKPEFIRPNIGEHVPIGKGVKAYYIRIGETGSGYKRSKPKKIPTTVEEAKVFAASLQRDYEFIKSYLGPYVPSTQFVLGRDEASNLEIVGLQREVKGGMSIKEALKLSRSENLNIEHIVDLYRRAVEMYTKTKDVPDFNGTGRFLGWSRPNSTRNVLVTRTEDGKLWPHVVDVGLIREGRLTQGAHIKILSRSILNQYHSLKRVA